MSIHRSPMLTPARAAAFDFDVVSDAPALSSRKPAAQPEAAPAEAAAEREQIEAAKA